MDSYSEVGNFSIELVPDVGHLAIERSGGKEGDEESGTRKNDGARRRRGQSHLQENNEVPKETKGGK